MTDPTVRPGRDARIGVREVAERAGVSTQTVSRVINDRPHIRPDTRARVERAMAELGYRVNNAARALGTATSRIVGVVASDATLYGPAVGMSRLDAAARAAGRWIATAYADSADPDDVSRAVERLLALGVDGIVVLAPHAETLRVARRAAGAVRVAAMHDGAGADRQRDAAGAVVDHLVALGHRVIARVSGPPDWSEAAARDAGADAALARAGLASGPRWVGDWSARSGEGLALRVAEAVRGGGVTAVLVANDQMALGLIAGLAAAGLEVPGDLSVAGFDDNPDAAFYRPALTTVRLDLAGEARRVVADAIGSGAVDPATAPTLVVRASTAPLAPTSA